MAVSKTTAAGVLRAPRVLAVDRRTVLLFAGIIAGGLILRLPSFFEPAWHTDEGIFAAVAQRVLHGGNLYSDVWESKPPVFIYTYVALIKLLGVGVLPLRLAATVSVIVATLATFGIARRFMSEKQALWAVALLTVLAGVPYWEGNLALADTLVLLPSTLALLIALQALRDDIHEFSPTLLLVAGALFGVSFLIRQTAALVPLALVLWLLVSGRDWLRPSLMITVGASAVVLPIIVAFAIFGSFRWFWDANVGFFFSYIPSGEQIPLYYRPAIVLPVFVTLGALLTHRRRGETPAWGLPAIWFTLALAAAMLTGRPYSHYFLQAFPPLALVTVMVASRLRFSWRPRRSDLPALAIAASVALLWVSVVTPEFGDPMALRNTRAAYYPNFFAYVTGLKSERDYNDYIDSRVNLTGEVSAELRKLGAKNQSVYVWGEYPWIYALSDGVPSTPYTTSFYVLLIPDLDTQLYDTLTEENPEFIVMFNDAWPRWRDSTGVMQRRYRNATKALNQTIAERYVQVGEIGRATIFRLTSERPLVSGN